jgi:hypothetical protein
MSERLGFFSKNGYKDRVLDANPFDIKRNRRLIRDQYQGVQPL